MPLQIDDVCFSLIHDFIASYFECLEKVGQIGHISLVGYRFLNECEVPFAMHVQNKSSPTHTPFIVAERNPLSSMSAFIRKNKDCAVETLPW